MKAIYWIFILSLLLSGCTSSSHYKFESLTSSWEYADLRLIDPVDAENQEQDILALYTRTQGDLFQIRLDFFDLVTLQGQDIYLLFDTNQGGSYEMKIGENSVLADIQWDYALIVPTKGNAMMVDRKLLPVYGLDLLISRDDVQDFVVVSLNKTSLAIAWNMVKIQVFSSGPDNFNLADRLQPILVSAPPPSRVEIVFLFWNVFSAETPARTLRSWYGAHSGPNSSRHGLKYLLDAAEAANIPIFLINFPTPKDIQGLDYMGVLPDVEKSLYKDITNNSYLQNFDLLFNEINLFVVNKLINVVGFNDYAQLKYNANNCALFSLSSFLNINPSDASSDCRYLFINHYFSSATDPLVIGGDFSRSILGEPATASRIFSYIQNHPWIHVRTIPDVFPQVRFENQRPHTNYDLSNSISGQNHYSQNLPSQFSTIYNALLKAPGNTLTEHALQTFDYLASFSSPVMSALSANYVHQVGHILAASAWVEEPSSIASCNVDPDFDGEKECILANHQVFVILEPEHGYIPFVFSIDEKGPHQIIGPSWEFLVGMSDPSEWDLSNGIMSDPGQYIGVQVSDNDVSYQVDIISNNKILLKNDDMSMRIQLTLHGNTLHLQVHQTPLDMAPITIPLTLDPWIKFTPNWGDKYNLVTTETGIQWSLEDGPSLIVNSTNRMLPSAFNATHNDLFYPEDPNHDYSRGHYLPYPMALLEFQPSESIEIELIISP